MLRKSPDHFEALHLLGVTEFLAGQVEIAARLIRRALAVDPHSAAAHSNLGTVLLALQRPQEALASCEAAIALKPDFADAHYNRGNALFALRRFAEAVAGFEAAVALEPRHADAFTNRGNALRELGKPDDAIASYGNVIALKPSHMAFNNRGGVFKEQNRTAEALADFDRALALAPDDAGVWANRGEALCAMERFDEALASHDRALSLNPRLAEALLGRAAVLALTKKVAEAIASCESVLAVAPDSARAFDQLGYCHMLQGGAERAIACFDRALSLRPDDEVAISNKIFTLDFAADCDFACHQQARFDWWRAIGSQIHARHAAPHDNDCDRARRIVVGYVSSDFRRRSAAYAARPVLRHHDKNRFEVICYSGSPREDEVTASFREIADRWRDTSQWSDDRLAGCIREDRVDILIDLSGHSGANTPARVCAQARADPGVGVGTRDRHRAADDRLSVLRSGRDSACGAPSVRGTNLRSPQCHDH
jgi:tetratricopeptide (TPR) repeat protein